MTEPDCYLHGSCDCGLVKYRVKNAFQYALNCHCTSCQKATGSAFKAFGGIAWTEFNLTFGTDNLWRQGDDLHYDARCRTCGSLLYSRVREGSFVHVTYGSLNEAPDLKPQAHIFVRSKAPWFDICDDLPQYRTFEP